MKTDRHDDHVEIIFVDVDSDTTATGVLAHALSESWESALVYFRVNSVVRARAIYKAQEPAASLWGIEEALRDSHQFSSQNVLGEESDETPKVSIVIPSTFERPQEISECLVSVLESTYRNFEILLINNRPEIESVHFDVLLDDHVQVLREPKRGISAARNQGIRRATGSIVAFIDDDVTVDKEWLNGIVASFDNRPEVAAVAGLVLPRELVTDAQGWFELHMGGFGRGYLKKTYTYPALSHTRGWVRITDEMGRSQDAPLHDAAGNLGVGANMAFRVEALRQFGGFDERLGAGLSTFGGEEILLFSEILLAGHQITYEPSVLAFHRHRRSTPELERQLFGQAASIPVFICCLIRRRPMLATSILLSRAQSAPRTLRRPMKPATSRNANESRRFVRQRRLGYLHGVREAALLMLSRSGDT